jgi:hypothetical protein
MRRVDRFLVAITVASYRVFEVKGSQTYPHSGQRHNNLKVRTNDGELNSDECMLYSARS